MSYRLRQRFASVQTFVETLPDGSEGVEFDAHPQWNIIRTMTVKESEACAWLSLRGCAVYCPVSVEKKRVRRGLTIRHVPVSKAAFAGYIFVALGGLDWHSVLSAPRVLGVVCHQISRRPVFLTPLQMRRFHELECNNGFRTQRAVKRQALLKVGERFRVDEGPLQGFRYSAHAVRGDVVAAVGELLGKRQIFEFRLDGVSKCE